MYTLGMSPAVLEEYRTQADDGGPVQQLPPVVVTGSGPGVLVPTVITRPPELVPGPTSFPMPATVADVPWYVWVIGVGVALLLVSGSRRRQEW